MGFVFAVVAASGWVMAYRWHQQYKKLMAVSEHLVSTVRAGFGISETQWTKMVNQKMAEERKAKEARRGRDV